MNIPFLNQIGRALKTPVFSGYGGRGGFGYGRGLSTGAGFDYRREAGHLWESSIPFMCLAWEKRNTVEAELVVQRRDENGKWSNERDHSLYELLSNPNPFWDLHDLLDCVRFDYHLSGNAYLWKRRSGSGKVVELYWLPSWCTEPRWPEDGLAQIGCYEYQVNGVSWAIPPADVIHFKGVLPDPRSHGRKGLSCFSAVLREVCTDNEAAVFTAALLRNMGVPGVIVSPKGTEANPGEMGPEQRLEFKKLWNESFTGERRGEPFVQSIPVDITMPGFSPQSMLMDKIRSIPETRIAGSFGIPLSVLQLSTGLENSNTKAGKGDDREQAIESCVIPTLLGLGRTLTRGLVREIDDPREVRLNFDLSEMRCLQEDENEKVKTLVAACGGPFLTVNEARTLKGGLKEVTGGETLRSGKKEKETGKDDDPDPEPPGSKPARGGLKTVDKNGMRHGEHDGRFEGAEIALNLTEPQQHAFDLLKTRAIAKKPEGIYLFDEKSEMMIHAGRAKKATPYEVDINEKAAEKYKSVLLIHSHTNDSLPSETDWDSFFALPWLNRFVTVTSGASYVMQKTEKTQNPYTVSAKTMFIYKVNQELKKARPNLAPKAATLALSDQELNAMMLRINLEMAREFGISFHEVKL